MKVRLIVFLLAGWYGVQAQDTTRLSLLFLGDIMQHDSQIRAAYDPVNKRYDYTPCFQYIRPYIESADLAIGNLELTLAGPPYKGYPQFSSPDELLLGLKDMGMDVLVTANNHCVDTGKKGLERTIDMLDSMKILHTGTFKEPVERLNEHPLLIEKDSFRLSLLNYTFSTNGLPVTKPNIVNRIDTALIRQDLLLAKKQSPDVVIVFVHWGVEYQSLPNAQQKMITEFCFKHGAQLVIGAHPHVLQPMEWRKDKNQFIAYSLGNFVSGQRKRYTDGGSVVYMELEKIKHKPDSSTTMIDSVSYMLEWVYRTADAKKKYYIMPAPVVENDTIGLIKDAASKAAAKMFYEDSRKLFKEHTIGVHEILALPPRKPEEFTPENLKKE
jgi:hypothetical protein